MLSSARYDLDRSGGCSDGAGEEDRRGNEQRRQGEHLECTLDRGRNVGCPGGGRGLAA